MGVLLQFPQRCEPSATLYDIGAMAFDDGHEGLEVAVFADPAQQEFLVDVTVWDPAEPAAAWGMLPAQAMRLAEMLIEAAKQCELLAAGDECCPA